MKDLADRNAEVAPVSLKGRRWSVVAAAEDAVTKLVAVGMSRVNARILASRGITPETLEDFLNPQLRNLMPDPNTFIDMDKAVTRIAQAIRDGQRIGIWSDYDADGATSAAVLGRFLRMLGHEDFVVRIPDRLTEGYGPNTPGLLDMQARQGCDLICILDAGIVAFEPLAAAKEAGIEVVVLDHHMAEEEVPEAVAVVNPNRRDQPEGYGHLCAAGLTFIFCVGVTRELRQTGWFEGGRSVPRSRRRSHRSG
ncbi:DHH family phosphoesterase [Halovulum marinum]|nr:DHH family phosphoesterase [Halovulum marinum]